MVRQPDRHDDDVRGDDRASDREGNVRVAPQLPALFAGYDTSFSEPRWPNPSDFPACRTLTIFPSTADSSRPETIDHLQARVLGSRKA